MDLLTGGRGEPEASRTFCTYLMETALQRLPPDMETVLGVFDFEGSGPQNIDLEFARFLVSHPCLPAAVFAAAMRAGVPEDNCELTNMRHAD